MTENTLPKPWQPQPHEPPEWVDRFHIYPVLGPSRTPAAASRVWTNRDSKPSSCVSKHAKKVALKSTRPRLPEDNPQGVKGGQRVAPPLFPPRRPFPLAWQEKGSIPNDCPMALPFSTGVKSPSAWEQNHRRLSCESTNSAYPGSDNHFSKIQIGPKKDEKNLLKLAQTCSNTLKLP